MPKQEIETIKRDVQNLIQDAQTLFRDASELSGESAAELRHKGVSLLHQALQHLRSFEESAVQKGREIASETNRYVHNRPWQAVGIAAGIGVLLGMLISRR